MTPSLENGELNFTGVLNREDEYFNNQNNTPAGLRPAVSKIDLTLHMYQMMAIGE